MVRKDQAGFRGNRSCVDQIKAVGIISVQISELDAGLYMIFVDFMRAFLTQDRNVESITKTGNTSKDHFLTSKTTTRKLYRME